MVDHHQEIGEPPLDQRLFERIGFAGRQPFEVVDRVVTDDTGQEMAPRVRLFLQMRSERQGPEQIERRRLPEAIRVIPNHSGWDRHLDSSIHDEAAPDPGQPGQCLIAVRRERLDRDGVRASPEPERRADPDQAPLAGSAGPIGGFEQKGVGAAPGELAIQQEWVGSTREAPDQWGHGAQVLKRRRHSDRPAARANGSRSRIRAANWSVSRD